MSISWSCPRPHGRPRDHGLVSSRQPDAGRSARDSKPCALTLEDQTPGRACASIERLEDVECEREANVGADHVLVVLDQELRRWEQHPDRAARRQKLALQ